MYPSPDFGPAACALIPPSQSRAFQVRKLRPWGLRGLRTASAPSQHRLLKGLCGEGGSVPRVPALGRLP